MADPTSKNFLRVLVDPEDALVEYARSKTTLPVTVDRVQANHRSDIYSIVAVHGLNPFNTEFHAAKTWTARDGQGGEVLWLRDFLPQKLPRARVLLFGYNSNVAFETSILGVQEQAENLLNWLKLKRREAPNRPIVFIAHSLGGIVVKKALTVAKVNATYEATGTSTYGIVFFGTPHRGGNNARLGDIAATLMRAMRHDVKNSFMESLKKDSLFSDYLDDYFKHQLEDRHIISFYETKPYKKRGLNLGLIVDKKSATLGLPGTREISIGLDSDHDGICKFSSATDDMYEQVSENIIDLVGRAIKDAAERQRLASVTLPSSKPHHGSEHCTNYPLHIAEEQLWITKEQLQAQKHLAKERLSEEEQRCHQLFRLTDSDRDTTYELYKDRVAERVDGTCMWFLKHRHFLTWLAQESGPLLVTADPGCGKSVLAKYLVDHGLPQSSTICYFFFHDHDQDTVRQALCALLHQLFDQQPSLIKHALPHYSKDGKGLVNSTRSLCDVFQSATQNVQTGPIIVVLDALDECAELEFADLMRMIKWQFSNSKPKNSKLKYLLTSRPYDQITSKFWDLLGTFPNIRIPGEEESETISEEVNRVIAYRVNQLPTKDPAKGQMEGFSPEIKDHLERRLQETTNRTYLWVYLVFDYLEKETFKKTINGINSAIEKLPKSINEAYEQILSKSKDHPTVRKVLCIILAATRPLKLSEMNIAISIEDASQTVDDLDLEDEQDLKLRLRSWCGLFISVHKGKIYFLHQTARDFLLANEAIPTTFASAPHWYSITASQAHAVLAKVCVFYLYLLDCESRPLKDERKNYLAMIYADDLRSLEDESPVIQYALLDYSSERWSHHLREANIWDGDAIVPLALRICDPSPTSFLVWFSMRRQKVIADTHLTVVSQLGLVALARKLLQEGAEVEARDGVNGLTPLLWATKANHEAVARLLLGYGADIEATDSKGHTPLLYAADGDGLNVAKLLLKKGAHLEARDNMGSTPLLLATYSGNRAMVGLLLENGADREARDNLGRTPLWSAAFHGHLGAIELLLKEGGNIEARDNTGWTPLLWAAYQENLVFMNLLLEKGADCEARNNSGWTPLWSAVYKGHLGAIELLLREGVNIEARDNKGWTPLLRAADQGDSAVMNLLLEKGAEQDHRDALHRTPIWSTTADVCRPGGVRLPLDKAANSDAKGNTPNAPLLYWAVRSGRRADVKLLLKHGAEVESRDRENGRTALSCAAAIGDVPLVALLLAKGAKIEARDDSGQTPLSWAARCGHEGAAKVLLWKGADKESKDDSGRTPLLWADDCGHDSLVKLLQE